MTRHNWFLFLVVLIVACGGGSDASSTSAADSPATTSAGSPDTTGADPTGTTEDTGGGGAPAAAGENSISYTVTGSIEDSGEEQFVPSMSFYDSGFWTMTFGGGEVLIIVSLDPATPSVNYAKGGDTIGGAAECQFDITSQDESGAAGSFDCLDAPAVVAGALDTASISGSFSASP